MRAPAPHVVLKDSAAIARFVCTAMLGLCAACEGADCVEGPMLWVDPPDGAFAVCGDLVVTGRRSAEVEVLRWVTAVEGSLIIEGNPELAELPDMPVLTRLGGALSISDNRELVHVRGYSALGEVGGGVYVGENPALTSLVLGDELLRVHSLFLALNPSLREFRTSLVEVDDGLTVSDNESLELLDMPSLTSVGGNFDVFYNMALRGLEFPELGSVGGAWRIRFNWNLETVGGFSSLAQAAEIEVSDNARLLELSLAGAFDECEIVRIFNNQGLIRVEGGPDVRLSDNAEVVLMFNTVLTEVEGLSGIDALERLSIAGNSELGQIAGFAGLTRVSELSIVSNNALTGPAGWLPRLANADEVSIFANSSLPSIRVDELLGHLMVTGATRVGDNMGQSTALDPCPWPTDGVCDASSEYVSGTGLCASDPEDCGT